MNREQLVAKAMEALDLKGRGKYKSLANKLGITDRALRYFRKAPSDKYVGLKDRIKSLILEQKKHIIIVAKQSSVAVGYYITVIGNNGVESVKTKMEQGSQEIIFFDVVDKMTPSYLLKIVTIAESIEEDEEIEFVNKFQWIASMTKDVAKNWQTRTIAKLPTVYKFFGQL